MAIKYIIQARQHSDRFPGKCFAKIKGKWIIQYIVDACKKSSHYKDGSVIFVIPSNDYELKRKIRTEILDKAPARISNSTNKNCLSGYLKAAIKDDDIVVRLTGDSPLIQTSEIDLNISKVIEGYDYAANEITYFGNACEAFRMKALREHSTNSDKIDVTPSLRKTDNVWIPSLMVDYKDSIKHIEEYL